MTLGQLSFVPELLLRRFESEAENKTRPKLTLCACVRVCVCMCMVCFANLKRLDYSTSCHTDTYLVGLQVCRAFKCGFQVAMETDFSSAA